MKRAILYVHGKGGSAAEADRFRAVCPGFDVLGVDYRGELPWEAAPQIAAAYDEARRQYEHIVSPGQQHRGLFRHAGPSGSGTGQGAVRVAGAGHGAADFGHDGLGRRVGAGAAGAGGDPHRLRGEPCPGRTCAMCGSTPSPGRSPRRSSMLGATIWCPARPWSGSRKNTEPGSPSWRAAITGSTQRSRWPYWITG